MKRRISLRELLLVTAVIALSVGWWFDHLARKDYERKLLILIYSYNYGHSLTEEQLDREFKVLESRGQLR